MFDEALVRNVRSAQLDLECLYGDGPVGNRPIYAAISVSLEGDKDILGLWAGTGGEGAKFWMSVPTDLRNRGVKDVFFVVCDGLKGLPEVVGNV